ncbi:unnamed protein product [Polarella glacialis]|uniref:Uncharacterized protein n=1 Tax=Polarella glacialis TaxID=89957 RepID=A0A813IUF6_POLGL|nr:unnamed protein product [Polarella glacialis]
MSAPMPFQFQCQLSRRPHLEKWGLRLKELVQEDTVVILEVMVGGAAEVVLHLMAKEYNQTVSDARLRLEVQDVVVEINGERSHAGILRVLQGEVNSLQVLMALADVLLPPGYRENLKEQPFEHGWVLTNLLEETKGEEISFHQGAFSGVALDDYDGTAEIGSGPFLLHVAERCLTVNCMPPLAPWRTPPPEVEAMQRHLAGDGRKISSLFVASRYNGLDELAPGYLTLRQGDYVEVWEATQAPAQPGERYSCKYVVCRRLDDSASGYCPIDVLQKVDEQDYWEDVENPFVRITAENLGLRG